MRRRHGLDLIVVQLASILGEVRLEKRSDSVRARNIGILALAVLICAALGTMIQHRAFAETGIVVSSSTGIPVSFTDIAKAAGLKFKQDSTTSDQKYYLETMGTGVAWLDYDQDGLMDVFFVQSAATDIYQPPHPLRCALYHNNGDGTFTDVTEKAGRGSTRESGQNNIHSDVEKSQV
jgi:hypothetical protein